MKEKIVAFKQDNFIKLHVLKLLAKYDITYTVQPLVEGKREISFHVINKLNGEKISDLIFLFVKNNCLYIESFYPNLYLQKDSKGLSAALAYLLIALYGDICTKLQQPIQKIHLRAEKDVADKFWNKLKGINLTEIGPSTLSQGYFEYEGPFPQKELNKLYPVAASAIKKSTIDYPFFKVTKPE